MKSRGILLVIYMLLAGAVWAAPENSLVGNITSLVSRSSGYHSVFLDVAIPAQGCTYSDRGVIKEADVGGRTLLATILVAISNGNQVDFRVSGCAPLNPDENAYTAPKIVKVGIHP